MLPVVVDSSAIVAGDWMLNGPAWKVLLDIARRNREALSVPEVVVREVVGKFSFHVADLAKDLDDLVRRLSRIGLPDRPFPPRPCGRRLPGPVAVL